MRPLHLRGECNGYCTGPELGLVAYKKADGDAGLDAEDVVGCAGDFGVAAHVRTKVEHIDVGEFFGGDLPEAVILPGIQVGAVGDEPDNPVVGQPVRCPAEEPLVHIVLVGLLGRAFPDVGIADAAVYLGYTGGWG